MMRSRILLLFLLATSAFSARAGDAGYVPKATDLLDRPAADAKPVTNLAKLQPVEVIGRSGSWASIKVGSRSGWIRMIDMRLNAAPSSRQIAATRVKSPTDSGIRGFSEEELLVGAPNQAESERLKRMGVSARDAANFARLANLRSRQQDYIEMRDYMPEDGFPQGFFDE
jgi:hypothetical protein